LNIGCFTKGGVIKRITEEKVVFILIKLACCEVGERIAISRKISN
jgi:translation initiation factor 2 subunit 3